MRKKKTEKNSEVFCMALYCQILEDATNATIKEYIIIINILQAPAERKQYIMF